VTIAASTESRVGPTTAAPRSLSAQSSELDHALQQVVQKRKYAWRLPRAISQDSDTGQQGILDRFLDRIAKMVQQTLRDFGNWLGKWLRKLFSNQRALQADNSGYGWILTQEVLLYGLVLAALIGLAWLVYHIVRQHQRKQQPLPSAPIQLTPDLTDEHVAAEHLPEDGWTSLGRELLARGELRLALRAFYFASLAHLAQRNLVSLAKFKSNHDYECELSRRAHSFPDLLTCFGQNVVVFDRVWYGLHELTSESLNQFIANLERIKGHHIPS